LAVVQEARDRKRNLVPLPEILCHSGLRQDGGGQHLIRGDESRGVPRIAAVNGRSSHDGTPDFNNQVSGWQRDGRTDAIIHANLFSDLQRNLLEISFDAGCKSLSCFVFVIYSGILADIQGLLLVDDDDVLLTGFCGTGDKEWDYAKKEND
jgi:hypothetical protein